jgi:putative transposase
MTYTQRHNRANGKVGHVFQGRFKAILVDKEGYLLELARYVVLNPVRAGVGLPSVREGLAGQIFLGDEKFAAKMQKKLDKLGLEAEMEIPRSQRRPRAASLANFEGAHPEDRDAAMRAAYASGGYSLAQIGRHFGVHYATVSRAVA